jgi:hypothetical protein
MQHMANSMIGGVSDNNVWYVDSGASNHMTSHGEWFSVRQLLSLYLWFYKVTMLESTNATDEGKMRMYV